MSYHFHARIDQASLAKRFFRCIAHLYLVDGVLNGRSVYQIIRRLLAPLALGILVGAAFVFLQIPGETRIANALQNSGHGLAFAALAFVTLIHLGIRRNHHTRRRNTLIGGVAFALFALGLVIELVQHRTGRGASGSDVLMNLNGIMAGTALAVSIRRSIGKPSRSVNSEQITAAVFGIFALLWCLRLPISIAAVQMMASAPPRITNFEKPFELARLASGWTPAGLKLVNKDVRWPANTSTILEARFSTGVEPGFTIVEPFSDWREYKSLLMNVFNTASGPVTLHIRVDQRAEHENIFWSTSQILQTGHNELRIDLASMHPDIELGKNQPFTNIFQILFFLPSSRKTVTLLFDDVTLAR